MDVYDDGLGASGRPGEIRAELSGNLQGDPVVEMES